MPWESVGTHQAEVEETGEMQELPETARARTLVLLWGVGLVAAALEEIQFGLGITYSLNSGDPGSE